MKVTTDPFRPFIYHSEYFEKQRESAGLEKFSKEETFFEKRRRSKKRFCKIHPLQNYINKYF